MQFYNGLKDNIKDEWMRQQRPDTLTEFIEQSVQIDNRIIERNREKQGRSANPFAQHRASRNQTRQRYGAWDPMDISATNGRAPPKKNKENTPFKCFKCGKPGHYARACRSPGGQTPPGDPSIHDVIRERRGGNDLPTQKQAFRNRVQEINVTDGAPGSSKHVKYCINDWCTEETENPCRRCRFTPPQNGRTVYGPPIAKKDLTSSRNPIRPVLRGNYATRRNDDSTRTRRGRVRDTHEVPSMDQQQGTRNHSRFRSNRQLHSSGIRRKKRPEDSKKRKTLTPFRESEVSSAC